MSATDGPKIRVLIALATVSAILLAYQVWLTRMIAIQHFHHLAPLIIAIALLGFGAAGVFVSLRPAAAQHRRRWLLGSAILTGLCVMAGALISTLLPLNMLALPWQFRQAGWLALYGLCFLPAFFSGAVFVSVCFISWPGRAGRIYAADLAGGAAGALIVLPLIDAFGLSQALLLLALLAVGAGMLLAQGNTPRLIIGGIVALAVITVYPLLDITPAEYKAQSERMAERGSRVLLQEDGLSRRFTVLDSPGMHAAPGLSLGSSTSAPRQWQWFTDGGSPVPLLLVPPAPSFYRQVLGHAPHALAPKARSALVLEAHNLWHTWVAAAAGVAEVTLATPDRDVIDFLQRLKQREPDGIYPDRLALRHSSPRRFLAAAPRYFDVITLSVHGPEAGMAATQENYLLTREGIEAAYARLTPTGVLHIEVPLHSLPREALRIVAMAGEMLRRFSYDPVRHVAVVRDWRTAAVMVTRQPLGRSDVQRLRGWARRHRFDLVALPDLSAQETNRFHQRSEAYYDPVRALLQGKARTADYLFDLSPPSDDRPFFFRFFHWQSLSQWLESTGSLWRQHLDWGYLLNLTVLAVGMLLASTLLTVPPLLSPRRFPRPRWAEFYFLSIGLGFMFLEIALLQKATLVLDATAVSMGAVLAAMLAGAGIGSLYQQRRPHGRRGQFTVFALIALLALAAAPLMQWLFVAAAGWPLAGRLAAVTLLIALMSIPLGIPLPQAVMLLRAAPPATIAWLWAVNGFAGVVGTLGAALIAVHLGLHALMILAGLCYLIAALALAFQRSTAEDDPARS